MPKLILGSGKSSEDQTPTLYLTFDFSPAILPNPI